MVFDLFVFVRLVERELEACRNNEELHISELYDNCEDKHKLEELEESIRKEYGAYRDGLECALQLAKQANK